MSAGVRKCKKREKQGTWGVGTAWRIGITPCLCFQGFGKGSKRQGTMGFPGLSYPSLLARGEARGGWNPPEKQG